MLHERIKVLFEKAYAHAQSIHKSPLVGDISKLWKALTIERSQGLADYFRNPSLRRAYLGYYMPLYAAKMGLLLRQLQAEGNVPSIDSPRVLDLGAGPLVGVVASHLAFGGFKSALALDREIGPMRQGAEFIRSLVGNQTIHIQRANLTGPDHLWRPQEPIDIAILSHVLNEMGASRRDLPVKLRLVKSALATLAPNGRLLIVEPATRGSTRELMALRDEIRMDSSAQIYAPCTGADRCPLLATHDGWCHGELDWERPEICKRIDEKIGFDKSALKYSYLLLGRKDKGHVDNDKRVRVVSGPMHHEGIARRYVCTPSGLLTLSEPLKHGSSSISSYYRGELINLR